jgi:anti-sigma B factor antagonist
MTPSTALMSLDPPEPFRVEERRDGDRAVLALHGELDLATIGDVRERLLALQARRTPLVLDLDGLTFMDSTGIRLVLQAAQEAERSGWEFSITRGSRPVRRVFEAAGLHDRLPFAPARP